MSWVEALAGCRVLLGVPEVGMSPASSGLNQPLGGERKESSEPSASACSHFLAKLVDPSSGGVGEHPRVGGMWLGTG